MEQTTAPRILRLPEVLKIIGASRSTVYTWIARGQFPAPIQLSSRMVGWLQPEVDEWVRLRVKESRGDGATLALDTE